MKILILKNPPCPLEYDFFLAVAQRRDDSMFSEEYSTTEHSDKFFEFSTGLTRSRQYLEENFIGFIVVKI